MYISYNLKSIGICVFVLICSQYINAQNLIPDSSFEVNRFVPLNFSEINASYSWSKPSIGTSDLFCKCGKKQKKYSLVNVPENPMGIQYPHSGSCYAGLFAFSHGEYREYLQTPLKRTLDKNKNYQFKMFISLADYSRAAIDQLGICFLNNEISYKSPNVIDNLKPIYMKIENKVRNDTISWHCLTFNYKANGDESYLIIGSFDINEIQKTKVKAPKEVRSRINQVSERDAYYFIDDVSLIEIAEDSLNSKIDSIQKVKMETTFDLSMNIPLIFKNILFKNNESILSKLSLSELDKVVEYLRNNERVCIEIFGHTDINGNENQNQILSLNRARVTSSYFISKNINNNRIIYKGYGSINPIATNDTEEGRRQNRRVELVLINK